jgi:hypothetical protein
MKSTAHRGQYRSRANSIAATDVIVSETNRGHRLFPLCLQPRLYKPADGFGWAGNWPLAYLSFFPFNFSLGLAAIESRQHRLPPRQQARS